MSVINRICVQCGEGFNCTDGSSICSDPCLKEWEQSVPELYEDDELDK